MQERPKARTDGLVVEEVEGELVAYDVHSQTAHALSREAAAIWQSCDGELTTHEIAQRLEFDEAVIERALAELSAKDLLDETLHVVAGHTRRQAAIKLAKVGGVAFAAPFIYSVSVATADGTCHCSKKPGCTANGQTVPNTANCATGGVSGSVACDCDCCSGTCYEGTSNTRVCVPAGCTGGNTPAPGGDCSKCCAGVCSGNSSTCASSTPS